MNPQELLAEVLDYVRGMWRYRWWAAGLAWLVCLVGWLGVYALPDNFEASAKVFVDTNNLLKPLMKGLTAPENTLNQVDLVSKAVLTRPNLEKVAHKTDLDLRVKNSSQMAALISGLQKKIKLSGGRDQIFTITYDDVSRTMARKVVAAVLDTFVNSAIDSEGSDTAVTQRALASEIKDHEKRLREAEERLGNFKKKNIGYMPSNAGDYYTKLQNALSTVAASQEKLKQLTQRRDELRKQVEGEVPVFGIMPTVSADAPTASCSESGQISQLEGQLDSLRLQYTDKYPPIQALQDTIGRLKKQCVEEQKAAAAAGVAPTPAPGQTLETNPVYQNLKIQLSNTEVDMAQSAAELKANQAEVAELRRDVDKITDVETQLKQLNRDYSVIQQRHQELLKRWEDLQAKKRLDPMTDAVQFRTIEPPYAAPQPVGPHRQLLLAAVFLFAVGGGLALTFGLNQIQPVFFSRRSLRRKVGLPVLGSISMILTAEAISRRRREALAWGASYFVLLVSAAAAIAFAHQGAELLRALAGGIGT